MLRDLYIYKDVVWELLDRVIYKTLYGNPFDFSKIYIVMNDEIKLTFNVGKCHTMCISTGRHVELDHSYTLNSHTLERVHHHFYLGVLLSEDLKWASHVVHVTSSANQTLGVIRRNFRTASVECKSQLYCSLVRSKLEYANSAWYPYLQKDKH